jgi:hypothetical protein
LCLKHFRSKGRLNSIARDYVLPDYTHIKRGFVRSIHESSGKAKGSEQVRVASLTKSIERGMNECSVPGCAV